MYLYKTTTFPHQPLRSISKVTVLHRFYCTHIVLIFTPNVPKYAWCNTELTPESVIFKTFESVFFLFFFATKDPSFQNFYSDCLLYFKTFCCDKLEKKITSCSIALQLKSRMNSVSFGDNFNDTSRHSFWDKLREMETDTHSEGGNSVRMFIPFWKRGQL